LVATGKEIDAETEKKADVYAFGVWYETIFFFCCVLITYFGCVCMFSLWEMITEQVPWETMSTEEINRRVRSVVSLENEKIGLNINGRRWWQESDPCWKDYLQSLSQRTPTCKQI
jgi:hypothetical protein